MRFEDIKQFPQIYYHCDVPLNYVANSIKKYVKDYGLDMNPDFQRDYVWTQQQKIKYIEYLLKNPTSGKEIYFNNPRWGKDWKGEFVIIDGKQRLNAVLEFLDNKVPAFGCLYKEFKGNFPSCICLSFNIGVLKTRKEVLQWYLDFNTGGTYHTKKEIEKVIKLIQAEAEEEK